MFLKTFVLVILTLVPGLFAAANGPSRAPQGSNKRLKTDDYFERTEMTIRPDGTKLLMGYDSFNPEGRVLSPNTGKSCEQEAVKTLRAAGAARVYDLLKDKTVFVFFLRCNPEEFLVTLPSTVHEAVHALTTQTEGYYLLSGSLLPAVKDDSGFMRPSEISALVDAGDEKVQSYINSDPDGSSGNFWVLLDEFNAYAHTLDASMKLGLRDMVSYERYSLLSMMKFVKLYADVARVRHPQTYRALFRADRRRVIQTLWAQAQSVLDSSCRYSRRGSEEALFSEIYGSTRAQALIEVLGGAVAVPASCR